MVGRAGDGERHVRSSSLRDRAVTVNGGQPRYAVASEAMSVVAVARRDGQSGPVGAAVEAKRRSRADPEQARIEECIFFVCVNIIPCP